MLHGLSSDILVPLSNGSSNKHCGNRERNKQRLLLLRQCIFGVLCSCAVVDSGCVSCEWSVLRHWTFHVPSTAARRTGDLNELWRNQEGWDGQAAWHAAGRGVLDYLQLPQLHSYVQCVLHESMQMP